MAESFNVYLDESCHLEHDGIPVMTLGAVWCLTDKARDVSIRVRDIQQQFGLAHDFEIKWTKVSPAKFDFYIKFSFNSHLLVFIYCFWIFPRAVSFWLSP